MNSQCRLKSFHAVARPACLALAAICILSPQVDAAEDLWRALGDGHKVVIMRHAPVEKGAGSGDPLLRDPSCENERRLSDQGKRDADVIGSRFRAHDVPVSRVLHSPYCRTTATAQIAFGDATPAEYLSLLETLTPEKARAQTDKLNQVIGSYQGEGNLVLVTHDPNITAISFEVLGHLDFLVVEPQGGNAFDELGVVRFSDSK